MLEWVFVMYPFLEWVLFTTICIGYLPDGTLLL